jgi:RNA polymerase sigma-70 factor, ECF subfamily
MQHHGIDPRHESRADGGVSGEHLLEDHRVEITRYCRRMLGSAVDADDAAQETLVRAWQGLSRFEGRSSLRWWLYRIATNVCSDFHRGRHRRAVPIDLSLATVPAAAVVAVDEDPAELAVGRESVRLALVAALVHLPHRQRVVLILRDVFGWRAAEVANLLEVSVTAVNSLLQRARACLAARVHGTSGPVGLEDDDRELVARYVEAFERYELDVLIERVRDDGYGSVQPGCDRPRRDRGGGLVPRG